MAYIRDVHSIYFYFLEHFFLLVINVSKITQTEKYLKLKATSILNTNIINVELFFCFNNLI